MLGELFANNKEPPVAISYLFLAVSTNKSGVLMAEVKETLEPSIVEIAGVDGNTNSPFVLNNHSLSTPAVIKTVPIFPPLK